MTTHVAAQVAAQAADDPAEPAAADRDDDAADDRAYQLTWQLDAPVFAIIGVVGYGRSAHTGINGPPAFCTTTAAGCDEDDINFLDRPAAGLYDEGMGDASQVFSGLLFAGPLALLAGDGSLGAALNDAVVIYEAGLLGSVAAAMVTPLGDRPRPFVYADDVGDDIRLDPEGRLSYFSGHAATAFGLATATFWTMRRRDPESSKQWWALGGGLAAATAVGITRVLAGQHFPTDVLAGGIVGASLGTLIPYLHESPVRVTARLDDDTRTLGLAGSF